jgi:hypothetical protein
VVQIDGDATDILARYIIIAETKKWLRKNTNSHLYFVSISLLYVMISINMMCQRFGTILSWVLSWEHICCWYY